MARLKGNYSIPGHSAEQQREPETDSIQDSPAVAEFERRAFERLGGSIAFVMKGKNVLWTGDSKRHNPGGGGHENEPQRS